jgi:pentatricopeptide repeat protein
MWLVWSLLWPSLTAGFLLNRSPSHHAHHFFRAYSSVESYNAILLECSQTGDHVKADNVWRDMLQQSLTPDKTSLELLLLTSLKRRDFGRSNEVLDECDQIMSEIGHPSEQTIVAMIEALGRIKLLDRVERLFDRISFSSTHEMGLAVYNAIIAAWAHSESPNAAQRTKDWYERLEFSGLAPNRDTFEELLYALSTSQDGPAAARECSALLGRMHDSGFTPSLASFEHAFAAWAQSRDAGAAEELERLMQTMAALAPPMEPSQSCLDSLVVAYSAESASEARENIPALLSKLVAKMEQRGGLDTSLALNALALSNARTPQPGSANRASQALERAEQAALQQGQRGPPPPFVYSAVIEALGRAGQPAKAEGVLLRYISAHLAPGERQAEDKGLLPQLPLLLLQSAGQARKQTRGPAARDTRPWNAVISAFKAAFRSTLEPAHGSALGSAHGRADEAGRRG